MCATRKSQQAYWTPNKKKAGFFSCLQRQQVGQQTSMKCLCIQELIQLILVMWHLWQLSVWLSCSLMDKFGEVSQFLSLPKCVLVMLGCVVCFSDFFKQKGASSGGCKLTWRVSRATRSRLESSGVKRTVISSFILMGRPDMGHNTALL